MAAWKRDKNEIQRLGQRPLLLTERPGACSSSADANIR